MTKNELRGNLDKSLKLKNDHERMLYWVRLSNVIIRQDQPPETVETVKAYLPSDWKQFQDIEEKFGIVWWKTLMHFSKMEVIHDPSLEADYDPELTAGETFRKFNPNYVPNES